MKNEFKIVEDTINQFNHLQDDHLESFKGEILPDIGKQSVERQEMMAALMQAAKDFLTAAQTQDDEKKEDMLLCINKGIQTLLEQNKVLEKKILVLREGIKKNMQNVSKGKKVISSYRSPSAVSKTPRVISITN